MRFLKSVLAATLVCAVMTPEPSMAVDSSGASVVDVIEISATPKAVFDALRKHRTITPGRKLVSYKNGQAIITEQFDNLPVLGKAEVTYVEEEHQSGIEYKLIESDKIKQFEGSWKLVPREGGKHTLLQLTSRTDTGMRLPFSSTITKNNAKKHSKQRLAEIKNLAETTL